MQRYNVRNDGSLSTIPVSIMMYLYSVLPIDVHDKSRENVVVVVGLGKLQEHLKILNGIINIPIIRHR
jgi:hypothetical protein